MKRSPLALLAPALIVLAVAAMAVGLVISGSSYAPPPVGIPDVGGLIGWGTPVLRTLTDIAAVVTIGFLLAAVVLDPSGKDGTVSRAGRTDLVRAAAAALIWALLALAQSVFVVGRECHSLVFKRAAGMRAWHRARRRARLLALLYRLLRNTASLSCLLASRDCGKRG